jgi:hypothetical protein
MKKRLPLTTRSMAIVLKSQFTSTLKGDGVMSLTSLEKRRDTIEAANPTLIESSTTIK